MIDPGYVNRAAKDFRLQPGSPCITFPLIPQAAPATVRKKLRRPVRLTVAAASVRPGQRVRLRARIPGSERAAADDAVPKVRRDGQWWRVGTMPLRDDVYTASVRLEQGRPWLSFGQTRIWSGRRMLRLRARVRGVGGSNLAMVRIDP